MPMGSPADVNEQRRSSAARGSARPRTTLGARARRAWRCARTTPTACSSWRGATCGCTSRAWAPTTSTTPCPVIVQGRGLLRLRRARQALPRRPLGALLRQRRPRPRRARRGRRRADRASSASTRTGATRTRPRSSSPRASPASRPGTSTACSSPPAARRRSSRRGSSRRPTTARAASTNRHKLVSRKLAYHGVSMGALTATGLPPLREPFEPLTPGGVHVPNTNSYRWKEDRDPLWAADAIEEAIEFAGPRHGRGGDPRAGPERRRLLRAPGRLLPARARDLRPPRRAADLRRGDLLVGPPRPLVRLRTLRLPAGHDHDRQGHQLGLRAARRGDRGRPHRRAVPARQGVLQPRLHVRRAPRRVRGRAREHRRASSARTCCANVRANEGAFREMLDGPARPADRRRRARRRLLPGDRAGQGQRDQGDLRRRRVRGAAARLPLRRALPARADLPHRRPRRPDRPALAAADRRAASSSRRSRRSCGPCSPRPRERMERWSSLSRA